MVASATLYSLSSSWPLRSRGARRRRRHAKNCRMASKKRKSTAAAASRSQTVSRPHFSSAPTAFPKGPPGPHCASTDLANCDSATEAGSCSWNATRKSRKEATTTSGRSSQPMKSWYRYQREPTSRLCVSDAISASILALSASQSWCRRSRLLCTLALTVSDNSLTTRPSELEDADTSPSAPLPRGSWPGIQMEGTSMPWWFLTCLERLAVTCTITFCRSRLRRTLSALVR
mmetsp:Transcript_57246/g.158440  ORF Transcript_57246/g.158440 Transcript_57246/m.158440 type:complete len:231 (-) Transcript_57246:509-1201(-)